MSGSFESNLRKEFRGIASANGYRTTVVKLGSMRKKSPVQKYGDFVAVFKMTAPVKARYFISGGRRNPQDLLYQSNIETLSLPKEIAFSTAWLLPHVKVLNSFIGISREIESCILDSEFDIALQKLNGFIESNGWSVWATELYFFLVKAAHGFERLKEVTESLITKSSPRIAALFFACLLDRNDDNYSVDAFFSKWKEVFSGVKTIALKHYLSYRAVTQIDDGLEVGMASCLSVEVLNSLYDCYETLVDVCATTIIEGLSQESIESAKHAAISLMNSGVDDVRLRKILFLAGEEVNYVAVPSSSKSQQICNLLLQVPCKIDVRLPYRIEELVLDVSEKGPDAEESLGRLLHIGVNLKALPFGSGLINFVFKISENDILSQKIDRWACFQSDNFGLESCAALPPNRIIEYLRSCYESGVDGEEGVVNSAYAITILEGGGVTEPPSGLNGAVLFWLGVTLVRQGRCEDAEKFIPVLNDLGSYWGRQANKLYIVSLVASGKIGSAVNTAVLAVVATKKFSSELILPLIFKGRKWKDFRGVDPLYVGIVAFCANIVQSDAATLYICRMACREVYKNDYDLECAWSQSEPLQRKILRFFFKNVWIEENLSLTEIATSQQARLARLGILQKLFTLDSVSEKEYAEEIKALTLHQTLWLGLKHINESRVFVNEPAILRWAEKELALDYERWKRTDVTPPDDNVLKDVITKFFSDQAGEGLKKTASGDVSSEQDVLMISIVERLLKRFLLDPADGLNSYLSSRIRHGSLRGTILGPLEEAGVLLVGKTFEALELNVVGNISYGQQQKVVALLESFSIAISNLVDYCNKEVIRVHTPETPNGKISIYLDRPLAAKVYSESAKVSNLPTFVAICFESFWSAARVSLENLSRYFLNDFKQKIQHEFDVLIEKLVALGEGFETLLAVMRSSYTATQIQCDAVASWFLPEKELEQRVFTLDETVEIANRATRNVYRLFNAKIQKNVSDSSDVPLTAYGFTTLSDCLYIILENSWKHSGLGSAYYSVEMSFSFDVFSSLLRIEVKNPLSNERLLELRSFGLAQIQKKYEGGPALEMVSVEGGSGIPKLAKISRFASRELCEPLRVYIDEDDLFVVAIYIPLYKRGDAYDAYYQ